MTATRTTFGKGADGTIVEAVALAGANGFAATIITHGAALQSFLVPGRDGTLADVVLGHDTPTAYAESRDFYGAIVGRYANRIAGAAFDLGGRRVRLSANENGNTLHGGETGFDTKVWTIEAIDEAAGAVTLTYTSPDGENGFPGNLEARATYRVENGTTLSLDLSATCDRETVVNLTSHSYFNLAGVERLSSILDHELSIDANRYLPVDAQSLPLGEAADVEGTPFDFRAMRAIGARIRDDHPQLRIGRGFDHNWCLSGERGTPRAVARLRDPSSGRIMTLSTSEPGLQFYSGNLLTGGAPGKHGQMARQSDALCLEPQAYPDSPNRPNFPPVRLSPGETYRHSIRYEFATD